MNHYCDKCSTSTQLIKKADTNTYGCPRCHSQFSIENNKLVRTAQFGGNRSKRTRHGPGSSPIFNGLKRPNQGINSKYETSIDNIISRTHNPAPIDPERNMEKRLEIFHTQAEEDSIPYKLDPKERHRLKIRKEIRRREKFYEDAAKRIDTNTVEYIKNNIGVPENQTTSIEEQLASKRKYEESKPSPISQDVSPTQISPERRHTLATKHGITSPFFNQTSEEPFADMDFNPKMLKDNFPYVYMNGTFVKSNDELDDFFNDKQKYILTLPDTSNAFDYQDIDETPGTSFHPKNMDSPVKVKMNLFNLPKEQALRLIDDAEIPDGLPQIETPEDISMTKLKEQPNNPLTRYKSIYPGGTTPIPGNHNE